MMNMYFSPGSRKFDRRTRTHLHRIFPRPGAFAERSPNFKNERHIFFEKLPLVSRLEAIHPRVAYINQAIVAQANAWIVGAAAFAHFLRRDQKLPW